MGRCKGLSLILFMILVLSNSTKAATETYILNPVDASLPTYNDNADRFSSILSQQAWFAFDLSSIPVNSTVISATFSAYMKNCVTVPSQRQIWYYSNDSWISVSNGSLSDPGDNVVADEIIAQFTQSEVPDDGFVWKTITLTYNNWATDFADGFYSLMLTGGQYFGAVGQGPTSFGENWGVDKEPELTLTVISEPQSIMVLSPNGGESLQQGNIQTITWYTDGTAGDNVKIELYQNNSYLSNIAVSTANDGEYLWLVPTSLQAVSTYKIKIIDTENSSTYDISDNYFSITDLTSPTGSLQFLSSASSVEENNGTVRIYVSRTDGSSGAASVNYATSDGTASAGSDYTQTTGTLFWTDGDAADKYFDVSITNDITYEGNEKFIVSLSNVVGASLGTPDTKTIIITDDDQPPYDIDSPEVETVSSNNINSEAATLIGLLVNDGSEETVENCNCKFSYWKAGDQDNVKSTDWQSGIIQGQTFNETISGLEPNTEYFFYAYASNSAGTDEGSILMFTTLPDPNSPPVAFDPNEPNTLLIQNYVDVLCEDPNLPHNNQGLLIYVEKSGNYEGIDSNDIFYYQPVSEKSSKIISLISVLKNNYAQDSLLELSINSTILNDPNVYSENNLKFWLAENAFENKTVTIQKVSYDPNIVYPVWDVNEIISKNGRKMPLDDLEDQELNTSYTWFTLSTSRQILDINEDGIVDINDYNALLEDLDEEGIYRSDIASIKDNVTILGIPDGQVDITDENAFITEYNKIYPDEPISANEAVLIEDFESGQLNDPLTTYGFSPWIRSNEAYQGIFCVMSGDIDDNQYSVLEATIEIPKGSISFWMKVSSELNYDELVFYIDSEQKDRWSGMLDWQQISYHVAPGTYTLRWIFLKDNSTSHGQDAAWIDNITIR